MPPEKEEERNPEKALTEKKGLEFGKRETEEEETSVVLFSIFSSLLPFFLFPFLLEYLFFKINYNWLLRLWMVLTWQFGWTL